MFAAINVGLDPVAFQLGPIAVHWYGIAYVVAIAAGLRVIVGYAPKRGIATDTVWQVGSWAIPAGFVGGRLYYVVQNHPGRYLAEPGRILQVWHGGMAFFGAIIAVSAVVVIIAAVRRLPLLPMLDVAAMFALIGQPFGRLGNVINGDIVGPPTDLPWGFIYSNAHSFAPSKTTAYQPAAIYEIIANVVLISVLYPLRYRLPRGGFAACYLAGYCLSQLVVFFWRSEPTIAFGLRQAQLTAIVLLVAEAVVVIAFTSRARSARGTNRSQAVPRTPD